MSRTTKDLENSFSETNKLLLFLSGVAEWHERISLNLIDPFKYEKYVYFKMVRERSEAKKQERRRIRQALSVLERAGRVVRSGKKFRLTPSGWLKFATTYARAMKKLKKLVKRGGKRKMIVMFDVPEREREARDALRSLLYALGFSMFQRSVFIGFDPKSFEVVSKVVSNARISNKVKLMVVEQIM